MTAETGMVTETLVFTDAMLVSGIILAGTFIGIFTEQVHGMERSKFAAAGAAVMIIAGQIFGFYSPDDAIEAVDWNVIFLLAAMMTIVSIMIPTGGFAWLAHRLAVMSKGQAYLMLVLLSTAVAIVSLLLDNVTTVVIFGPLIILIASAQKISPVPYLLAAALFSDAGGVATLIGDPPNVMIGSAADIDFNTFLVRMGPVVLAACMALLVGLRFLFGRELAAAPADISDGPKAIKDEKLWRTSLIILGVMLVLFTVHDRLHWAPSFVAVLGVVALIFASRKVIMEHVMEQVEITLLIFFIGLFMVIGGVERSQFLSYIGQFLQPFVEADLLMSTIVLLWVGAALSALIDNIPITASMIPIILGMEAQGINVTPLWWGLAIGVGMGGNGTHIGSAANVFIVTISERLARERNDPKLAITPALWFKKATPAMLLTLIVCSVILIVFFEYFARPVRP